MRRAFGRHTEVLKDEDILEIGHFVPDTVPMFKHTLGFDWFPGSDSTEVAGLPEESPIAIIVQPEARNLTRMLEKDDLKKLGRSIKDDLKKYDFYFVELCCSFQPKSKEKEFISARFTVALKPDEMGRQPQVYTMYPMKVFDSVKEMSKVGFDASLKFVPIIGVTPELKGTIETGVEYMKLVPKIVAYFTDTNKSGITWDFLQTKVEELRGVRYMYLLARVPLGAKKLVVKLDLSAEIQFKGKPSKWLYEPWKKESPTQEIDLLSEIGKVAHPPPPT